MFPLAAVGGGGLSASGSSGAESSTGNTTFGNVAFGDTGGGSSKALYVVGALVLVYLLANKRGK